MNRTILLQVVNKIFDILPLTKFYRFKSSMLRIAGVDCSKTVRIVSSAKIIITNVQIGEDTFIGHQVLITGDNNCKVHIGNFVDLAPRVCVLSGSHKIDMIGKHSAGDGAGSAVFIEDGVWIGANSTVLPGVTIGEKSIIGAGSVVNKNIPPYCIAVGNPCRPIKLWNSELEEFELIN